MIGGCCYGDGSNGWTDDSDDDDVVAATAAAADVSNGLISSKADCCGTELSSKCKIELS